MKKIYALTVIVRSAKAGFLLLFLSLATFAFSQQKPEFGFVLKGGTYGIPEQHPDQQFYFLADVNTIKYNAGNNYSLGIWSSWPVDKHLRFSVELLFRSVAFQGEQNIESSFSDGLQTSFSKSYQVKKTTESSLALPISLYFSYKKVSFSFGAGVSQAFSTDVKGKDVLQSSGIESTRYFSNSFSQWRGFPPKYNINVGFHYKIDPRTMLGLEYTFENHDIF
ncbi:MAG: hypothetical protein H7246_12190, partial [Phycisphaerae bacterium]|nr:hypothetical protein [Saprospiraceae bacterium]